jgi:hypothetical protein
MPGEVDQRPVLALAHVGLDESGSWADPVQWFTLACVLTYHPEAVQALVRRVVRRRKKLPGRSHPGPSEYKWNNSSRHLRESVLAQMAKADLEIYTLTVNKGGRKIEDTPQHYSVLVCELLQTLWTAHPNLALVLDRRFTSPAQIAILNTVIYRHWPAPGVLSLTHADSQQNALVQLADFAAGSTYAWHKDADETVQLLSGKIKAVVVKDWPEIKRSWLEAK